MNGPNNPMLLRRASPGADRPEVPLLNWLGGKRDHAWHGSNPWGQAPLPQQTLARLCPSAPIPPRRVPYREMRFPLSPLACQAGAIEIDGVDAREFDLNSWRSRLTA